MAWTEDQDHCFFLRQPRTPAELDQAILAMEGSEVCALRYRGNDPKILERLRKLGLGDRCDALG